MDDNTSPTSSRTELCILLLCAVTFSLMWFLPVLDHLGQSSDHTALWATFFHSSNPEHTLGADVDLIGSIWIVGKMNELLMGQSGTILNDIFVPIGYDFGMATGFAWLDALFAVPLLRWIGYPGFYNLHLLTCLALSTWAAMLLFRQVGSPLPIAVAFAHLLLFNPFVLQEINAGRPTQVNWIFPCLTLLGVLKMTRGHHVYRWSLFTGGMLAAGCFVYWFSAIPVGFCGALYFLFHTLQHRQKKLCFAGGLAAAVALALTLSITARVSLPLLSGKTNAYMEMNLPPMADLMGLPIQNFIAADPQLLMQKSHIPTLILLVGVPALVVLVKRNWPLVLSTVIALGIPLGAAIGDQNFFVPTGYDLLHWFFPPLLRCQWPERMMIAPALMLLVGASMALRVWLPKLRQEGLVGWLLALALLIGNLPNQPQKNELMTDSISVNQAMVAASKIYPGGIIEVPYISTYDSYSQQIFHQQPILGGPGLHNVRPNSHERYCQKNTVLQGLEELAAGMPVVDYKDIDLQRLRRDGFRLVLIHLDASAAKRDDYERFLKGAGTFYEEDNIFALPLPP